MVDQPPQPPQPPPPPPPPPPALPAPPRQLGAILHLLDLDWNTIRSNQFADVLDWLYRILDTLDQKTSHLLTFLSLILAAETFLIAFMVDRGFSRLYLLMLLIPLVSAVVALSVFRIEWFFLGKVQAQPNTSRNEKRIREELVALAEICDTRVTAHRRTFVLSVVSIATFAVSLLIAALWCD